MSLEDRARAAFFSNYVFHGSKSYDFLGPFYAAAHIDEPLAMSLEAVSLAFFALQESAAPATIEGRYRYATALAHVKQAINSPVLVRKDSTLLATMLLDLYEKITNFNPGLDQAWKSHVQGSLALVGLRESRLFRDRNEFRMLVRLSTNILISCVATDTKVPVELVVLRNRVSEYVDMKDPKWLLTDLMLHYVSLRENIREGQLSDRDVTKSLMKLDAEFVSLAVSSPVAWQGRTVQLHTPTARVFGDYIDTFLDHHITQTRNVNRMVRILLHELLREYSVFAYWEWSSLMSHTEETISKLVNEICASVPQYTCPELVEDQSVSPSSCSSATSKRDGEDRVTGIRVYTSAEWVRAYTLIFPLYIAGQSVATTQQQKTWIIDQLQFMAGAMGIRNAEVVAKILETGVKMNPWKVYAILGSYAFAA